MEPLSDLMTTAAPHPAVPKPNRRWYQFRLRTLLIAAALVAIVASLGSWGANRALRRERAEEEAIRQAILADPDDKPGYEAFAAAHVFPYSAPPARRKQIETNYGQLRVGMRKADVARNSWGARLLTARLL